MSGWHAARRLLASGEPMYSCTAGWACGWAGSGAELAEWGGEGGGCPRCGAALEAWPTSGLATIGEVARAMADMDETAELAAEVAALGGSADRGVDPEDWLRVDALFGRMPDPVEVWRAVGLPEGEPLDEDSIGMCWAWDSGAARAHNAPGGVGMGDVAVVVAHGTVAKADVDWPETFALNILLPDEREIRLRPGAGVRLLDVDGRRVNRRVTAENRLGPATGRRVPTAPACWRSHPG